ncbi:tRNA (5-methylaminomethyl-2-thiouridine)(34)-methyltransferase MnmD [Gilvibacter sp.]|uniref:tRNA (5-methylaminomethyl-2-thiouridine)(34)-methyltransferase MnmD n=1 Tax=Gilvibacter sp. TaxID=2729997 RepID=UPI003F49C233
MKRELIQTGDGSWTIQLPDWDEQYHSKHGAIAEAKYVFIKQGLQHKHALGSFLSLSVLEIGFGTGLNALLSLGFAKDHKIELHYTGMEAFPIAEQEWQAMRYPEDLGMPLADFQAMHEGPWEQPLSIDPLFTLTKQQRTFDQLDAEQAYDLIYFDAFGPRVQPELWHRDILEKTFKALKPGGVWVSYCAKGDVRRDLQSLGFEVERLDGPPGKRHMLRATKP